MPKLTKKISVTDGRTDPNYRKASLLIIEIKNKFHNTLFNFFIIARNFTIIIVLRKENLGIVPFVATPIKGRLFVFSQ